MPSPVVEIGQRFSYLVVLAQVPARYGQCRWYECRCDCGRLTSLPSISLTQGNTKSCGCQRAALVSASKVTHGHDRRHQRTPEYRAWAHMIHRCHNPKGKDYPYYGGRGITVCDRWRNSFEAFLHDVGPRPSLKHSIDRWPDPNGNYEENNVRWALHCQQMNNMRRNRIINWNGRSQTVAQWANELGIKSEIIRARIDNYGWTLDAAMTTPIRRW